MEAYSCLAEIYGPRLSLTGLTGAFLHSGTSLNSHSHPLAADPSARVVVFIDGQNLYQSCARTFGHPLCHPHLLAEYLAGPRRLEYVRFYSGRPDQNIPGEVEKTRNLDRRLQAMQRVGVLPRTRRLRYHWDWGHRERLPRPEDGATAQTVTLRPWQRPQEKGIDLLLALDLVGLILGDHCDVAIVVSLDRDLCEIPSALRELASLRPAPYRLEAAVPVSQTPSRKRIAGFHFTHHIGPELFELIRDDTDYTVSDEKWKAPILPKNLEEQRRIVAERAEAPARAEDIEKLRSRFAR